MTRLVDIAKRTGVSKSTVSNVIRGTALVAETTRKRVERAIAEAQYRPNAIARSLKARASLVIGLIVPDLTNPYYGQLAAGVERAASARGYAVLAAHTECAPAIENEVGRALIDRRVDGVVIGGVSLGSPLPAMLLDRDIPVVLASLGDLDDPRLGMIDHDDAAAMEAIVAHLLELGHRRITFASHGLREHSGERRRLGLERALRRRRLAPVKLDDGATAIVAHNDVQAITMMNRLETRGHSVPGDISVVGYDDIPLAAHHRIQLTTIRSNAMEMAGRAIDLVIAAARANRHVAHREIAPNPLVIRASTAKAKR